MGRISSLLLLLVALLEVLEALLVGGRLSLPAGPGIEQSEDIRSGQGQMEGGPL